jgi:hypothetical protein
MNIAFVCAIQLTTKGTTIVPRYFSGDFVLYLHVS